MSTYLENDLFLSREPRNAACLAPGVGAAGVAPVKADERRLGVPGDSDLGRETKRLQGSFFAMEVLP
jgi:hypothetical protein